MSGSGWHKEEINNFAAGGLAVIERPRESTDKTGPAKNQMTMARLQSRIKNLPDAPGVYIFKDKEGRLIYIGKAKSLKARVQSYFKRPLSDKNQIMVSKISDLEYIFTPSESQAQLLEASLIKDNQPQYNISLKDDKSFPRIRITDEEFPVVSIARRKGEQGNDRSLYFGPYTNVKLLRQAVKVIRKIFGFRSCKKMPAQACLYYRLKLCPAPCIKKISVSAYREIINQIQLFLDSRFEDLIHKLAQKMEKAGREQKFEEAAKIRDQLSALNTIGRGETRFNARSELEDLKKLLKLDKLPERIEAFDISNISGKEAAGSLVSFYRAIPDKNNYRRFRIKTVESVDDYGMLREVIRRRYFRALKEKLPLPDLILIDGGRSHLSTAEGKLKQLGLQIPLVSIAKDRENVYTQDKINPALSITGRTCKIRKGGVNPIKLKEGSPALNLMRRIRDEAHRFAVAYHHVLRRKKILGK